MDSSEVRISVKCSKIFPSFLRWDYWNIFVWYNIIFTILGWIWALRQFCVKAAAAAKKTSQKPKKKKTTKKQKKTIKGKNKTGEVSKNKNPGEYARYVILLFYSLKTTKKKKKKVGKMRKEMFYDSRFYVLINAFWQWNPFWLSLCPTGTSVPFSEPPTLWLVPPPMLWEIPIEFMGVQLFTGLVTGF